MARGFVRTLKIAIPAALAVAAAGGGYLFYRIQKYGPPSELQVHAMNPDGSGARLLSKSVSTVGGPTSWSPDGEWIVFEKQGDVCRMNSDGSGEKCLTKGAARNETPKLSPDGTRIAFGRDEDGVMSVWTMASDGSDAKRLTKDSPNWNPFWSPDGSTIAFETTRKGGPWIYLMNADGSNQRPLAGPRKGKDEDAAAPAWSPDGRLIAFDRGLGSTFEIYVIKPDGTGERRLTNNGFADISPSWSPNGKTITLLSTRSL